MWTNESVDTHAIEKQVNNCSLENVTKWYPVQEPEKRFQCRLDQARLVCFLQHLATQLEDLRKLPTHLILEILDLGLSHLFSGKVEDLFGKKFKDDHVVFAKGEVGFRRLNKFRDKGWPVVRPFLFQDLVRVSRPFA